MNMDRVARTSTTPFILGMLGLALALALYAPWCARPFDMWDFPEFLPLLLRHRNVLAQFTSIVEYYSHEGRFSVLPYAFLALKWNAFGWHSALWQGTRFVQMVLIVIGAYWIIRNFVRNRAAAALAAGLFICAATAATAWIRLTMGEPLVLMFLLGAIALACRFQGSAHPMSVAVGIALLMVGILLSKEMIAVATVPFIVLLAWSRASDGTIERIRLSWRNGALLGICVVVLLPASVAIATVALRASSQAYISSYGSSPLTLETFLVRFTAFIIPAWPGRQPVALTAPINVCFLSLLAIGWSVALGRREQRGSTLRLLGLLLLLPALGALVYLPLPTFGDFYGLPFLITPAILLAVALDAIAGRFPAARRLAYVAAVLVILGTAAQAKHNAGAVRARDEVNFALLDRISQYSFIDTVYVASPLGPRPGWRLGSRIAHSRTVYTHVGTARQPPIKDVSCGELRERERSDSGNVLFVSYSQVCGSIDHPSVTLIRRFSYLDPAALSVRPDSFRVDLLAPQQPQDDGKSTQAGALWPPSAQ
jgi:hypothetical protein